VLLLAALFGGGCKTAVGNYFANRSRDLGECFSVELGVGFGAGAGASAAGIGHLGLGYGRSPDWGVLSWEYGHGTAFGYHTGPVAERTEGSRTDAWTPIPLFALGTAVGHAGNFRGAHAGSNGVHVCLGYLPVLFDENDGRTADALRRWRAIHAWDIDAAAYAGVITARAGFSPGEFLDFLLGWFGVDIAEDDHGLPKPK